MLCSDGVLESWNDNDLKALFATHNQVETLTDNLKSECSIKSRDNFTAIVFKIKEANIINTSPSKINTQGQKKDSFVANNQTIAKKQNSISRFFKMRIPIGLVLIIALVAIILFFILSPKRKKLDDKRVTSTESINKNPTSDVQPYDKKAEKEKVAAEKKKNAELKAKKAEEKNAAKEKLETEKAEKKKADKIEKP
jgi:hypothetical protein